MKKKKDISSEIVRGKSVDALTVLHLWIWTACFNPHRLKIASSVLSYFTTLLQTIWLLLYPLFLLWYQRKLNSSHSYCARHSGQCFWPNPCEVCYFSTWNGLLSVCHAENLSTMSRFSSALYKHRNTSLHQNQRVCTCSGLGSGTKTSRQFIFCVRGGLAALNICDRGWFAAFLQCCSVMKSMYFHVSGYKYFWREISVLLIYATILI